MHNILYHLTFILTSGAFMKHQQLNCLDEVANYHAKLKCPLQHADNVRM